jgi:hypothetical protein
MILLVYPSKGIVKIDKTTKHITEIKCQEAYDTLGMGGIEIFKNIFDNNNKKLIYQFF